MRVYLATSCLFVSILISSSVWAQLPNWESILVHVQKAQPERYHVMATYEEATTGSRPPMAIRVVVRADGALRLDIQDVHHGHTKSRVWNLSSKVSETPPPSEGASRPPAWLCWLVAYPLSEMMADKAVATARVSLSHLGGVILWVVGAGPQQPDVPQLHFERESGRLRRSVDDALFSNENKRSCVTFEPGTDPSQRGWPMKIVFGKGKLRRELVNTLLRFDHPPADIEFESLEKRQIPSSERVAPSSPTTSSP